MKRIILIAMSVLMLASLAISADISLRFAWDPNTEPDMKEYRLYRTDGLRTKLATFPHPPTFPSQVVVVTIQDGTEGTLSFVLTAVDTAENESGDSNTVIYPFDRKPPAAPGALRLAP